MIKLKDAQRLKKDLAVAGYNQVSFSKDIGMSSSTISEIIRQNKNASPKTAKKICDQLNATFDDYFFYE